MSSKYYNAQAGSGPSHRSHKHHGHSGSSKGGSSSKTHSSSKANLGPGISFLFVVNEFYVNFEKHVEGGPRDQWLNFLPPTSPAAYEREHPGIVFRYHAGVITQAVGYEWHRPALGQPGCIMYRDPVEGMEWGLQAYKTESVFSCSAHLPVITLQGDASLGSNMQFTSSNDPYREAAPYWALLHFADYGDGVSRANSGSHGGTIVAGKNPSWIPSLVPRVFENTMRHTNQRSKGLAGDLTVVIAMMAFHSDQGNPNEPFLKQWWHKGKWRGPAEAPRGYPDSPEDNPRGFLVHICPEYTAEESAKADMGMDPWDDLCNAMRSIEYDILVEG